MAPVTADMLTFEQAGKRYPDGTVALSDVTLRIARGQFCVLLGPSGAGKSTLLRMANGLVTPTEGQVSVDATPVVRGTLARIRPRIGMIHQRFNLVPRLTVATNVLTGALPQLPLWRALGGLFTQAQQHKACELLASVGLEEAHLRRRASELSGGQLQRVGIARAFMLDPSLVLADEPVASLDPKVSRDILALLRQQSRQRGATLLCSLHQLDLAREFADRIVALRHGRVVFDGPPGRLDDAACASIFGASSNDRAVAA
jgi:phosphonate transport system ATP-binding protein